MYELIIYFNFSAAHRLQYDNQNYIETLHGHNWQIEICLRYDDTSYWETKYNNPPSIYLPSYIKSLLNNLEETYLNKHPLLNDISPSSEHFAYRIYEYLKQSFTNIPLYLHYISVWEDEDSKASYQA